jgi:hypothetical protein
MKSRIFICALVAMHMTAMDNTPGQQTADIPKKVGLCTAGICGIGSIPLLIAVPMHGAVTAVVATGIIFGSFCMGYSVTTLFQVACAPPKNPKDEEIPLRSIVTT